jgi:small subunit ribosomal protein S9
LEILKKEVSYMAASKKKRESNIIARGKRKEAIARAVLRPGKGKIRVNGLALEAIESPYAREIISEPTQFVDASAYDIDVNVSGGGAMGQAQAARTAIARALIEATRDEAAKAKMIEYDRSLLVEDSRRVEPKKFKGPKARARFTKSYR